MTKATATKAITGGNPNIVRVPKNPNTKRPFVTQYFIDSDASGKMPASMGYAASVHGARKNMAVRIVVGEYGLAVVLDRASRQVLSVMRRTKAGMSIKDAKEGV